MIISCATRLFACVLSCLWSVYLSDILNIVLYAYYFIHSQNNQYVCQCMFSLMHVILTPVVSKHLLFIISCTVPFKTIMSKFKDDWIGQYIPNWLTHADSQQRRKQNTKSSKDCRAKSFAHQNQKLVRLVITAKKRDIERKNKVEQKIFHQLQLSSL